MIIMPNFDLEISCGKTVVAGVDEAGRGPLCGPVVAAAVVIPAQADKESKSEAIGSNEVAIRLPRSAASEIHCTKITDSKKLSHAQRIRAFDWIMQNCSVGIGQCSPAEIDELNILQATMLAMKRSIDALPIMPEFVLVDGNRLPDGVVGTAIVKGDSKSLSIAAASIVAKVTRDKIMRELHAAHPEYGWDKNSGYPTKSHCAAILKYGITKHHRRSFGPCKSEQ